MALVDGWEDREPRVWALALSHPEAALRHGWRGVLTDLATLLLERRLPILNQNWGFDARWIRAMTGVDLSANTYWDTAMASRLLYDEGTVALKPMVSKLFRIPQWDDGIDFHQRGLEQNAEERKTGRPPLRRIAERVPLYDLMFYAAGDTIWCWRLAQMQQEAFDSWEEADPEMRQLGRLNEAVSVPTVRAVTRMSGNGLLVDKDWIAAKRAELVQTCAERDQEICDLSGLDPATTYEPSSKLFRDWADRRAQDGTLRRVAMTKTGKTSWAYSSLVANRQAGFEIADLLIQYRKASKSIQYLDSWSSFIGADGRVRPTYNLYRTVTGRLSSSEPNGQQLAKSLRPMVVAPPGKLIMEADLSQAELRIAAFVSGCRPMIEALQRGDDLHRLVVAAVTGKPVEDVTKVERQAGKAVNFGFVFTMREETFVEYAAINYDVHFTYEEAVAARKAYFDLWDGLAQWHEDVQNRVLSYGYVKSPIGRIRRPSGVRGDYRSQYRAVAQAVNSPVQGFVSDIIMIALDEITKGMPWATPVACVHDSIVLEIPEDRVQEAAYGVRERMTGDPLLKRLKALGCDLTVPLVADISVGKRWGEGVEM